MATSNNPLAPDPVTNIDGPEVFPPIEEPVQEDLGEAVPLVDEDTEKPDDPRGDDETQDL
jgi:hypothetical protein